MGKARELMSEEELEAERERVRIAAKQNRARKRADALRTDGRLQDALQVLRDAGLSASGDRIEPKKTTGTKKTVALDLPAGDPQEFEATADTVNLVPLAEYREAGELIGTLSLIFRLGLDPTALLSGAERHWLEDHPFGAAVVEERMVLRGLAEDYELWAAAPSL